MRTASFYERHLSDPRRERGFLSALGFTGAFRAARAITHAIKAGVFGNVSAGGTLDEIALWLNLEDDYWSEEGRKSVDAVALFGGLLAMGVAARSGMKELGLPKPLERLA